MWGQEMLVCTTDVDSPVWFSGFAEGWCYDGSDEICSA